MLIPMPFTFASNSAMAFGPGSCCTPSAMTLSQTGSSQTPSPFESYLDCAISALAVARSPRSPGVAYGL